MPADVQLDSQLLVGAAIPGMSSLIAVDHLVATLSATQVGHAKAHYMAAITPFTDGVPRYAIRLYNTEGGPTLLVGEVIHPIGIGERFADAIGSLAADNDVDDITILYSVPYPHSPDDHAVFVVGTADYPKERLQTEGIKSLGGGFFDSYTGRLLELGLAKERPAVGRS